MVGSEIFDDIGYKLNIFRTMGKRLVCVSEDRTIRCCLTPDWEIQKGREGVKER